MLAAQGPEVGTARKSAGLWPRVKRLRFTWNLLAFGAGLSSGLILLPCLRSRGSVDSQSNNSLNAPDDRPGLDNPREGTPEEIAAVREFFASISESERKRLIDLFVNGVLGESAPESGGRRARVDGGLKAPPGVMVARNGSG